MMDTTSGMEIMLPGKDRTEHLAVLRIHTPGIRT